MFTLVLAFCLRCASSLNPPSLSCGAIRIPTSSTLHHTFMKCKYRSKCFVRLTFRECKYFVRESRPKRYELRCVVRERWRDRSLPSQFSSVYTIGVDAAPVAAATVKLLYNCGRPLFPFLSARLETPLVRNRKRKLGNNRRHHRRNRRETQWADSD